MKEKLIFLDIDGTLVYEMKAPSLHVKKAINRARANGHKVFLCTGRNMPIIGADILDVGFDGIIASAGSHVQVGDQVLFDSMLSEAVVQECLHIFHAHGMYCRIETKEGIYTDPQMEALLKSTQADPANSELIRMQKEIEAGIGIQTYDRYPGNGAYKICFTSRDLASVEKTKTYLGDRFVYAVHAYADSGTCFNGEIIPKGIDKGRGIRLICDYFHADLKDTIAFGDSMNDYEMMQTAGIGVAMGNACEELKKAADIICGNVWEDGLYYEFCKMKLA